MPSKRQPNPLAGVEPERTVYPRKRGYTHMPLVVVHNDMLMDEHGGVIPDLASIPDYVRKADPSIFVTTDPSRLLAVLDNAFSELPGWHYTLTRSVQEIGFGMMSRVKLRSFGVREEGKRKKKLHQCWDPRAISPTPFHKFVDEVTHATLMVWAQDVREWACGNNLDLRNALAGYAAQLLRDDRFYPEPRRKVPRATNEKARPSLPGNLIELYAQAGGGRSYNVTSIDQRSAHHRIVQSLSLPDANTLFARGFYAHPEDAPEYWAEHGSPQYQRTMAEPGLLFVGLHSRYTFRREHRLPLQDYQGYRRVFVYTNMIPFIEANGSHIEGIVAAWTSETVDTGLSKYGAWAQDQIENALTERKRWLKPLLHSTYGLLAARPRPLEVGYRQSCGGKPEQFLLGAREFDVNMVKLPDWQPAIANVIQRGMIEAETQVRSLRMAQQLTAAGCRVLHIHTDGMHVEGQLPLLPDDWAITALTRVTYIDRVSWIAKERECLPGRDVQARMEVVKHYAGLHATLSERGPHRRLRSRSQRAQERANLEAGNPGDA